MSTLIELTEQELTELQALTREAEPSAAIRSAMIEYVRFARRLRLKEPSGRVQMEDNWQALEQAELREQDGESRPGVD